MKTPELTPKYKEITFSSKADFNEWLKKTTHVEVKFEDHGQDLLKMWIAKNGEIIHCNMQASVYNGLFVNLEALLEFTPIEINIYPNSPTSFERMGGLIVESIELESLKRHLS